MNYNQSDRLTYVTKYLWDIILPVVKSWLFLHRDRTRDWTRYSRPGFDISGHGHECEIKMTFLLCCCTFYLTLLSFEWSRYVWITFIGLKNRARYEQLGELIYPLPIKFSSFWFFIDINALIINTPYYIELSWCVLSWAVHHLRPLSIISPVQVSSLDQILVLRVS